MRLLDAVNLIMPKLGERAVTSLTAKHPTLAVLLPIIEQTKREVLGKGWWFNQFSYNALPDNTGEIVLGSQTIRFVPDQTGAAVVRGKRLYNPENTSYKFTGPVKGLITEDVDFDLLPDSAAHYVFYNALVEAYATDIGVSQELGTWQMKAGSAWSELLAEHLQQRRHSTHKTKAWRKYINALQG